MHERSKFCIHFKNSDILCVPLESVGLNPTSQLRQISCSLVTSKDIMLSKTTEYNIYIHANQHYAGESVAQMYTN